VSSFQHVFGYVPQFTSPEPEEFTPPVWFGPPSGELGVCVPLSVVVGRSEKGVVAIRHATAYSTGLTLDVVAAARGLSEREAQRLLHEQHFMGHEEEPAPSLLRLGIELADGSRASNLEREHRFRRPDEQPQEPVLFQHGGGGGSAGAGRVEMHPGFWLWPLPPPGPVRVFVEWPAVEISLSSIDFDAQLLRDAAARSRGPWED
jgi:hypothetical protein